MFERCHSLLKTSHRSSGLLDGEIKKKKSFNNIMHGNIHSVGTHTSTDFSNNKAVQYFNMLQLCMKSKVENFCIYVSLICFASSVIMNYTLLMSVDLMLYIYSELYTLTFSQRCESEVRAVTSQLVVGGWLLQLAVSQRGVILMFRVKEKLYVYMVHKIH